MFFILLTVEMEHLSNNALDRLRQNMIVVEYYNKNESIELCLGFQLQLLLFPKTSGYGKLRKTKKYRGRSAYSHDKLQQRKPF